jgi:hypothetical protein
MANQVNKDDLQEGYTEFEGAGQRGFYRPTGMIGRFFSKFFTSKGQREVAKAMDKSEPHPYAGDTVVSTDVIKETEKDDLALGGVQRNPIMTQLELNRKRRYREYEDMDTYPEVGAAFDIYADDSTQRGPRNERWVIKSESEALVNEVESLFKTIRLDKFIWDITRNTVKYGDCFTELIVDINKPQEGIKKVKILNPNYIIRLENEYGYLKKFKQEIPNNETFNYGTTNTEQTPVKYIDLDKNQIVHFRLHTSDPLFYPYGKSIAALCHMIYRSLKMMEDAMMIYRLSRAPERRIFYVDTGTMPASKAEMFIERLKQKFKKEKYYNTSKGTVDARYNPLSMDEDFFVPTKNGKGTKIDTLPGATNLGEIEDVRYYRDKLLAALKIPKDYIVEKEGSPERKANLSQPDVKFARTIHRIQTNVESGLESMAKRHLYLKGFPPSQIQDLRINLPEPSDMSAKRKLDLDEQKTRVIQAVLQLGLFPKKEIYREYYDMTEDEAERMIQDIEKEASMNAEQEDATPINQPGYGEAGGQEGVENEQPTANESKLLSLENVKNNLLEEDKKEVLDRIIKKQQEKAKD